MRLASKTNAQIGLTTALVLLTGQALAVEKWDMPTAYADSNFHTENAKAFAACVNTGSDGELEIVVHASGSLLKGSDIKRAVQTGQVPIGERLLSAHQNEDPIFGVDSVPFLATGYEASDRLYEIARPALAQVLNQQDLVLLYSVPWPPQGIYANKELNSAADMQGVKFRSYNAATARMAELMGAVPVQVEAAELSQALATGVAESFISSGSTGYDRKVWEHLSNWYDVNAWLPRNYVMVNKSVWDGLDQATQQTLTECAASAEESGTAKSRELNNWYKQQLINHDMNVEPPTDEFRADLEAIGATMTEEWLDAVGETGAQIVDRYRQE